MKRCLMLLTALLLVVFISGCNSADDDGNNIDGPENEVSANGVETPDDVPDYADSDPITDTSNSNDVLELFAQLAFEMDADDQTTTRERMIELFGVPSREDDHLLEFEAATDFGIIALLNENGVWAVSINPIPDFFIDETLQPDFERLNSYVGNVDGLTLDYFRELLGTPGFLHAYGEGIFSYTWMSSAFFFWVDVWGNNEVESVFFEEGFQFDPDEAIEPSLMPLPGEVMRAIDDLVNEMQDNNGQISVERLKEIIVWDYSVSEQIIVFPIVSGVEFFVVIGESGMVEYAFMSIPMNYYLNEELEIDIDELNDLAANAEGMALEEFEDAVGVPRTFLQYSLDEFTYIWITPDITVIVGVNQDNEIFEIIVNHFVG